MAEKGHWIQRIADGANLYGESLPGVPVMELAGDRRVLIERHEGVMEYGPEQICIRVKFGMLCISGCGLELRQMTRQQLIISGRIDCIRIHRRCCP